MFWVYVAVMAALGGASLVLAIPGVAIVIVMLTFGLGIPLLAIPTLFAYGLSLAPAVWIARGGARGWNVAIVAAAGLLGLGLAAPALVTLIARTQAAAAAGGDVSSRTPAPPRRIEMVDSARSFSGRGSALAALPCDVVCQKLLLGGEVDLVRVAGAPRPPGRKPAEPDHSVSYRFEARAACPQAFDSAATATPASQLALAEGRCIIADIDAQGPVDARVVGSSQSPSTPTKDAAGAPHLPLLIQPGVTRRLEIVDLRGAQPVVARRQTEFNWRQIPAPVFHVGWNLSLSGSDGLDLRSAARTRGKIEIETALRETLGYRLDFVTTSTRKPDAALVARILDEPGEARFGPEKQSMISEAMREMSRKRDLEASDAALLRRAVADARLDDAHGLTEALSRHPEAAAAAMGEILARLAAPSTNEKGHMHNALAWVVARAPLAIVRPHRDALAAILMADAEWGPSPLLIPLARLGGDRSALLGERLGAARSTAATNAARAICAADASMADRIAPLARGALEEAAARRKRRDGAVTDQLLIAIRRFGSDDEARQRIAALASDERETARMTRRVMDTKDRTGARMCDPSLRD